MRFHHRLGGGLLTVGLCLAWAGAAPAQDAPAPTAEQPKAGDAATPSSQDDAKPAADAPAGREARRGEGRGRRMDPQRMLDRMVASFAELNLSDEQKAKVREIVDKAKPKLEALAKETEGKEPGERMAKVREVAQPIREELMGVLDETQRQRLRERMEAVRQPRGGRGGPQMIERMRENFGKLDLSNEQKKQVEALLSETEKQIAAIRDEAAKAPAAAGGAGGETRAKFRELMQANRKRLNEILTPEQRQKLREMTPRRDGGGAPGGAGGGDAPAPQDPPREPL